MTDRAPFRLKVVGGAQAVVGVISIIGATGGYDMTRSEAAWNVVIACILIVAGAGLCLDARWAWPIALLVAVSAIGLGSYLWVQPGDITTLGAPIVALVMLIIPGLLMVLTIVTPRSVRWFRRRSTESEPKP